MSIELYKATIEGDPRLIRWIIGHVADGAILVAPCGEVFSCLRLTLEVASPFRGPTEMTIGTELDVKELEGADDVIHAELDPGFLEGQAPGYPDPHRLVLLLTRAPFPALILSRSPELHLEEQPTLYDPAPNPTEVAAPPAGPKPEGGGGFAADEPCPRCDSLKRQGHFVSDSEYKMLCGGCGDTLHMTRELPNGAVITAKAIRLSFRVECRCGCDDLFACEEHAQDSGWDQDADDNWLCPSCSAFAGGGVP